VNVPLVNQNLSELGFTIYHISRKMSELGCIVSYEDKITNDMKTWKILHLSTL